MTDNILSNIVASKRREVARRKELFPTKLLEESLWFPTRTVSLRSYLSRPDLSGIIAEFKRQSPSRGTLHSAPDIEQISIGYMQAGAAALSILTDGPFFGGSNDDLIKARRFNFCPILRKDFILDEYQVIEAKSIGSDVILLIAAILTRDDMTHLARLGRSLGMEILVEVHDGEDLSNVPFDEIDLIGINNRSLKSFEVDVSKSFALRPLVPSYLPVISESGINDGATVRSLRNAGFSGFLIGEAFMRESRPETACAQFIASIREG